MVTTRMNWTQLLSGVRLRDGQVKVRRTEENPYDYRNDFEDDYTRLVTSAAVRRLQDKAQVFPLDNSDFVRTRLTHSHEVSTIGQSLGISVERKLAEQQALAPQHVGEISKLLAVAGLAHDLGNPPFGHFGEAVIQQFFREWFTNNPAHAQQLTDQMRADFTNFEGNAQSFRLLTKLQTLKDEYGYNLSAASLASVLKYPRSSLEGNKSDEQRRTDNLGVSYKKFGYMAAEQDRFEQVVHHTGIRIEGTVHRHPVTFLMEAADDIAYSAADIEDGCKKKVLDYHLILDVFTDALGGGTPREQQILENFRSAYQQASARRRADCLDNAVQQLRIDAQGFITQSVVQTFLQRHDDILNGTFDQDIIKASEAVRVREAFETLSVQHIFSNKEIITRELVGGQAIRGLLGYFVDAVKDDDMYNLTAIAEGNYQLAKQFAKSECGKHFHLISDNYRYVMEQYASLRVAGLPSLYDRLLLVTDFVCGMTDTYALELYQKLSGIKL